MRRIWCLFLILALFSLPILAQEPPQTPPFRPGKAAFQLAAGVGGGALMSFGGAYAGAALARYDPLGGAVIGIAVGYAIGSPLGVYLAGSLGDETACFWATMAGGLGGGVLALATVGWLSENVHPTVGTLSLVALPPVSALAAYQLTRRYKEVQEE